VNRLGSRLLLAMVLVALVSLAVVPLASLYAERGTIAALPSGFRERVIDRTTPAPLLRGPMRDRPAAGMGAMREAMEADPSRLREENAMLYALLTDSRAAQRRAVTIGVLVALGVSVALAYVLSRGIARPIESVSAAAARLGGGALQTRVRLDPSVLAPQEARTLTDGFNAMAASIEGYEAERKAMLADIAHELRTPLAAIQMRLEALDDGLVAFDRSEVELLRGHTDLLARLIGDLRLLSLADAGRLSLDLVDVDLAAWVTRASAADDYAVRRHGAELHVEVPERAVPVRADPQRLEQVFLNLLDNAARFSPPGERVDVTVASDGDRALLRVRDRGPGVAEQDLATLFDRFAHRRRRDRQGHGTGLGLAIVRTLVALHGGSVRVRNREPGAEFTVALPLVSPGAAPSTPLSS
jgi:two-component system, OmpR family, sensor histidine kinase BaeS